MSALTQTEPIIPDVITPEQAGDTVAMMGQMDQVYNQTARTRHVIEQKLLESVSQMNLDPNGDPEKLEAQLKLLNGLDGIASSREKAITSRINTRMKQSDTENSTKLYGALVAKVLKELHTDSATEFVPSANGEPSADSISAIESKMAELNRIDYNDGEVKTNNKDIS